MIDLLENANRVALALAAFEEKVRFYAIKEKLPEPVVAAVLNDPYDNGGSDYTVTQLLNPPQLVELSKRHRESLQINVADRLWSVYGQLMHGLLERAVGDSETFKKRYISEARMFVELRGLKVSGQLDLYDSQTETLFDYKFVGGYAVKMAKAAGKKEWEEQLNMLRWLLFKERGITAKRLAIVAMVRDFSERMETEGIPAVGEIDFPVWSLEAAEYFINSRLALHMAARSQPDRMLLNCTDEERWFNKKSGLFNRCRRYCNVKDICEQNKNTK